VRFGNLILPRTSLSTPPLRQAFTGRSAGLRRGQHQRRAVLQSTQDLLQGYPRRLDDVVGGASDRHGLADGNRHPGERLRDLRAIPAAKRPGIARFDVKREDRMTGCARQPDGAALRDTRRTARAVDGKGDGTSGAEILTQLYERSRRTA